MMTTNKANSGSEQLLLMRGVTKRFNGILANYKVDFELRKNEVHCLLGENGAGKTTLMNILYGLYRLDKGEIFLNGRPVHIENPKDAVELGIGMIHQFFTMVPTLTVIQNIILGKEPKKFLSIDENRAESKIKKLQDKFNLPVDLYAKPRELSGSEKQKAEILKALYRETQILIMDEPTAVLSPQEKDDLIRIIRDMAGRGKQAIIFITHKLSEAIASSDRITILRNGTVVETLDTKDVDIEELTQKMFGRNISIDVERELVEKGEIILEVSDLEAIGDTGTPALRDISFQIRRGEILGIAGVSGNGQKELVEVIMGLKRPSYGSIYIKGTDISGLPPRNIRELGVGYTPEDKLSSGVLPKLSVAENLILGREDEKSFTRHLYPLIWGNWLTDQSGVEDHAKRLLDEYNIDAPNINIPAGKLSGGNIQKLILAREISRGPDLMISNKPTSGLDIGSRKFIRQKLLEEKKKGKAILLVSDDLDEILMMSDRIAVMYEGKFSGVLDKKKATKERIGELMVGVT